ncbi:MAG: DUF839 domain-containing protein, partial [Gammaproteobacteria bacterium]|nr:DUF839 domain-containing protein [Gammaproteobacteria bacterium]
MRYFGAILEQRLSRRDVLAAGSAAAVAGLVAAPATAAIGRAGGAGPRALDAITPSREDAVRLSPGLRHQVLIGRGDPLWPDDAGLPPSALRDLAWLDADAAAKQTRRFGECNDALAFFPADATNARGLLCVNHEYVQAELVFAGLAVGGLGRLRERDAFIAAHPQAVAWMQAAHGVSVLHLEHGMRGWSVRRGGPKTRRITADTPMEISGPARGDALLRTDADPSGTRVRGTFANCAGGKTPWGTYLSGEENWAGYFRSQAQPSEHERRWGLRPSGGWNKWPEHDERFHAALHPNEPNRFGWIVELDPMDPTSTPIKRTALGRAAHEGAWVATTREGRAVVYSGEDARFEYIYKFVSRDRIQPAGRGLTAAQANRDLLDHGTLYVARFDADGTGRWLPLLHGQGPLNAANGFADQGEVVIKARQASDLLGATKMDRPEWLAID